MKGSGRIGAVAACLAVLSAFLTTPSAWDVFKFRVGNFDLNGETVLVEGAVEQFSSHIAGFYATGGMAAGYNTIPAEKLVKRRIAMDIRQLNREGQVFVMDRDRSEVRQVLFDDPAHAVAVVDENWYSQYQDAELRARKPLSGKKLNLITVKYLLEKKWSRWIVLDYDVYMRGDEVMLTPPGQLLSW